MLKWDRLGRGMRMKVGRKIPKLAVALVAGAFGLMIAAAVTVRAAGSDSGDVPDTSIVPAPAGNESGGAPSPGNAPMAPATAGVGGAAPTAPAPRHHTIHHAAAAAVPHDFEVEPAKARLKVVKADWVYSAPAKSSKHLEQMQADKFVNVTGSTHYFLRVALRNGETGYIDPSSVDVLKPNDKIFMLSHDAAVLDKPNKWGKKLAEVHQGHNVHIVALALDYARIRMKSGLEGFIPLTAME